jgi:hypothetical protein
MKIKPSKPEVNARLAAEQDQIPELECLREIIARLNQAIDYGIPELQAEDINGQVVDTSENTFEQIEPLPEPFPENDEDYDNALKELISLKLGIREKSLMDTVGRYMTAAMRKHHAWLWQQNFPDASLQDKDKIWFDLEQADEEVAELTQELNERIEELMHE